MVSSRVETAPDGSHLAVVRLDMAHLSRLFWGFDFARGDQITIPINDLVATVRGQYDLEPPYQRPSVWTLDQKERFLAHWLCGGEVSRLVLNVPFTGSDGVKNSLDEKITVIDGQQRLRAWMHFMAGVVCARMPDGRAVFVEDVTRATGKLSRTLDVKATRVNLPLKTQAMLYLRLNEGGTPHSEEDLDRARTFAQKDG